MLISPKDNNFYNFRSELILKLVKCGYDVVLVCPYGEKIDFFTQRGCRFINLSIDRRGTNILKDVSLFLNYWKILSKEKPDLVLTYTTKCSVYAGIGCRIKKIPYIVNNAGLIETGNHKGNLERFLRILYKVGFKKAKCMMYQNTKERDVINKLLNNKVHYREIPGSGVNLDTFKYKLYPKDDNVIIFNYVARIVEIKGIKEFLECAKRIKKKYANTKFLVYGDYDDNSYKIIINKFQNEGIIEYRSVLLDIRPAIELAHAVIYPSYYEGMSNVILEHSAMGRVCIASNIPGVREGIEEGKTGFLFDVKDKNSMYNAIQKFIELPNDKKSRMGKLARERMELKFDRNIVTNIYLEEIKRIIR